MLKTEMKLFIVLLLLNSCINRTNNESKQLISASDSTVSTDCVPFFSIYDSTSSKNRALYLYENDTFIQKVSIVFMSDSISFIIDEIHKYDNQSHRIEGIAIMSEGINASFIEDENERAYSVDVYKYTQGNCLIYINIDNIEFHRLTYSLVEECTQIDKHPNSLGSLDLLTKQPN